MPQFSARAIGVPAFGTNTDPTSATTSILLPLGAVAETRDGRVFRWAKAGSTADLVAGNTIQSAAFLTNHTAMAIATPTATLGGRLGDTFVNVTPGNTGGAANLYAEGWMTVSVTLGLGYTYQVSSHAAITASTAFNVNLMASDGFFVALNSSSKVDLIHNRFQNVIQFPITTQTGSLSGVAPYIITASQNGWLQTKGPCAVLNKGTTAVGLTVGCPGSVAGGCVVFAVATTALLGHIMQTGVDASCNLVNLCVDV
jgi:hypothetical protein